MTELLPRDALARVAREEGPSGGSGLVSPEPLMRVSPGT
jgi:hypothetical protein